MRVIYEKDEGMHVPIKIWGDVESKAIEQMKNVSKLPFIHKWASIMPDGHMGYGCPIGSVIPCDGYILPYLVSSDIGCGMSAIPLGININILDEDDIDSIFHQLQLKIPVGFSKHGNYGDINSTRDISSSAILDRLERSNSYAELINYNMLVKNGGNAPMSISDNIFHQMGTLGGGNHFFELQQDSDGQLWFMVHSGSRNLGAKICGYHYKKALEMCTKYHSPLEDNYLAYLPSDSQEGKNYIEQMNIALDYAYLNREEMILQALEVINDKFLTNLDLSELINIHHNYAAIENHFGKNIWVHRKGATSARDGQIGIIPGSMCTKSYIVRGKGFQDSFMSCSHGSGRNFSRKESKKRIEDGTDPSVESQLNGVKVFGSNDVSDEVGSSYKDVEDVMKYQEDLVDIVHELTPVAVLKG